MAKHKLDVADSNLLIYVRNHQQAIFSGLLSTIAITKLKYPVDENTKFQLSDDLSEITITQIENKPDSPDEGIKVSK